MTNQWQVTSNLTKLKRHPVLSALLKSARLETDTSGAKRTIYSLRHTYATFRLHEGVNQYLLARNMGTSAAMLEKHYEHTSSDLPPVSWTVQSWKIPV